MWGTKGGCLRGASQLRKGWGEQSRKRGRLPTNQEEGHVQASAGLTPPVLARAGLAWGSDGRTPQGSRTLRVRDVTGARCRGTELGLGDQGLRCLQRLLGRSQGSCVVVEGVRLLLWTPAGGAEERRRLPRPQCGRTGELTGGLGVPFGTSPERWDRGVCGWD